MRTGRCSLIICGEQLDFEFLNHNFNFQPSRITRKEDEIPGRVGEKSRYDFWIFEIKFNDDREPDEVLQELLAKISPVRKFLSIINENNEAHIKCFIQSDLAQIGFTFEPKTLQQLVALGLRLEVSVFSWGGVEDS